MVSVRKWVLCGSWLATVQDVWTGEDGYNSDGMRAINWWGAYGVVVGILQAILAEPFAYRVFMQPETGTTAVSLTQQATPRRVTLVAMLVDFSPSSMVMRFVPVKPSADQLGLKEHQFIVLCLPIEWKTLQFEPNSPYPDSPHFISPEGKRISPYDLEPGMRVKLRVQAVEAGSIRTEEVMIEADTVRLVSWKLYFPPARLRGQLIEVDSNSGGDRGRLQVGDRIISMQLRRKVQLHGDKQVQRDFRHRRLLGLRLGMELEVRGYWFSWASAAPQQKAAQNGSPKAEPDTVLVEAIQILK